MVGSVDLMADKRISFAISEEDYQRLTVLAAERTIGDKKRVTMTDLLKEALKEWFRRHGEQEKSGQKKR